MDLHPKELENLQLIAEGMSNLAIAKHRWVSLNTVNTQVKSAFRKLGVHKRQDAVRAAREKGLL